jgi:hypothetical protein
MAMNMRTNRLGIGGVVAGGLILGAAGLVIGAGLASADTYGSKGDHNEHAYAMELRADGMAGTDIQAEGAALMVCEKRGQGFSEEAIKTQLETLHGMSVSMAGDVVEGGEWHFCPQFENEIDGIMRGHYRVAP